MKKTDIQDLPRVWREQRDHDGKIESVPEEGANLIMNWVGTYVKEEAEIRTLLEAILTHAVQLGHASGVKNGRQQERAENPAIKSVGEAVAVARRTERAAMRAILTSVFDSESARGNPYHAFAQALKAVAD